MVHTELTSSECKIKDKANKYVRKHRDKIVEEIAGDEKYINPSKAISIFMAGAPGAGKTETSKYLLAAFDRSPLQSDIILLDPDSIRELIPQYKGGNAHIFQQPITYITNQVFNHAIKTNKNILVDSTFSNFDLARQNVSKSLKKNRLVQIVYTYINPFSAWEFTQARERKEGRKITKEVFVRALYDSKECVKLIKAEFGNQVAVVLMMRDDEKVHHDIDDIDKYVKIPYSKEELSDLI